MDFLTVDAQDDIVVIALNRPDKRNAISDAMVAEIEAAVIAAEGTARAGVIYGEGPHFCAGLDLAEHVRKSPIDGIHGSRAWHRAFDRIERGRIPWVSALHGAVVGGGLELAAATHVRVADRTAFFALPEGQRGIFVGGGGSVRVARLTGVARMTDMMLTGRSIDAETAESWNLVQYVVPEGGALARAIDLATKAAGNAEITNYAIVNGLSRIQDMSAGDGLFLESFLASFTATSPEAEARLTAFLEKRAARVGPPSEGG